MSTFDASGLDDLPLEALRSLGESVGDFVLIGQVAIDLVTRGQAHLPPDRLTRDVDVAIAVASRQEFHDRVLPLGPKQGTSFRFRVAGSAVDVLPYGDLAVGHEVIVDEDHLDVAGMADADRTAVTMDLGEGVLVRVASLSSLVALKLIAWTVRGTRTNDKDAHDVTLLLRASGSGDFEDELWNDNEALEAVEFDPYLAGPYRVGRQIAGTFETKVVDRIVDALSGRPGSRIRSLLASPAGHVPQQLDALLLGLRTGDEGNQNTMSTLGG
jgi:predicted nucleotidyltransferase